MKKHRKFLVVAAAAFLVLASGLAWNRLANRDDPVAYLTETVVRGDIRTVVDAVGQVDAVQLVSVGAQVSGQILRLPVKLGQQVKKGDLVAEIDSTTQLNELNAGKAQLESYRARLTASRVELDVARARYDREKLLSRTDATSRENLESAESAWAAARAAVAELESQIVQAEIAVNTAETNVGYTRITAPLDGTVVSVPVEEGQTVNANQTTPTIVQIADLSRMKIRIEIAEGDITKVRPGMTVEYTILSDPGHAHTATLDSLDPGLTTLSDGAYDPESRDSSSAVYYYANAVVPNEDGRLRIGMTTQNAILTAQAKGVLLAPVMAVETREGRSFARVLTPGGRVEEREVTPGLADAMNVEIRSGLDAGERVILSQISRAEASATKSRMPGRGPF